jgi:hypothetical protein
MWLQQACYPEALAPAISFPPKLPAVKRQAQLGAAEVWGDCAGAEVYKRYSRWGVEAGLIAVVHERQAGGCV